MSWLVWAAVAVFGGLGSIGRFLLDGSISRRSGGGLPLGTFWVNVSGSALLGLLTGLALTGNALLLAGTATLGSYTTFSTWIFETHRLAEDSALRPALLNVVLSLAAGVSAAALGRAIA